MSPEERKEILQTIEMFEVITQTNPDDWQSLEILKEAYERIGKQKEALIVARKLEAVKTKIDPTIQKPEAISEARRSGSVSPEEKQQVLETIAMFEVITKTNPSDCQSLEILKQAYRIIGKQTEAMVVTFKLANIYVAQGQYSLAVMQYVGLLQKEPNSPEIENLLKDVEAAAFKDALVNKAANREWIRQAIAAHAPVVPPRQLSTMEKINNVVVFVIMLCLALFFIFVLLSSLFENISRK